MNCFYNAMLVAFHRCELTDEKSRRHCNDLINACISKSKIICGALRTKENRQRRNREEQTDGGKTTTVFLNTHDFVRHSESQ